MTKANIVSKIYQKHGLNRDQIEAILEGLFTVVQDSVAARKTIYLRGFGNFYAKHNAARRARNIKRNLFIDVAAYDSPAFKPSKEFIKKLNP